ncbi:MAG: hypothetical protein WCQ16_11965 [Verrucomicrobiae bacterium]
MTTGVVATRITLSSSTQPAHLMIKTGILNPQINSLLNRVRHTNTLVIADTTQYANIVLESA